MSINPKTKVIIPRIAALLFALAGVLALVAAFQEHKRTDMAKAVIWFTLCIVFLAVGRVARKSNQSSQTHATNPNERTD